LQNIVYFIFKSALDNSTLVLYSKNHPHFQQYATPPPELVSPMRKHHISSKAHKLNVYGFFDFGEIFKIIAKFKK